VESTLGSAPVRSAFCALLRDPSCADGPADPENLALRSWCQISYQVPVRFDGSVWFQYLPDAVEALLRLEPGGTWSGDDLAARIRQFVLLLLRGRGPDGERPLVQGLPRGTKLLEDLQVRLRELPETPARARELARCEALRGASP